MAVPFRSKSFTIKSLGRGWWTSRLARDGEQSPTEASGLFEFGTYKTGKARFWP